jgi:AcrR family transcriptional regulator
MSKGERTKATILQAAVETACLNGFEGLNLQPLADKVQMTKSGLYAHFGSKEALQLAVLETAMELFQTHVAAPAKHEPVGLPRLRGLFRRWLGWPNNAGIKGQCLFISASFECDDWPGPLRDRLQKTFKDFVEILTQMAMSAQRHGHLPAQTHIEHFIRTIMALRFGHQWQQGLMNQPDAKEHTLLIFEHWIRHPPLR